jgi:hypothetical protein
MTSRGASDSRSEEQAFGSLFELAGNGAGHGRGWLAENKRSYNLWGWFRRRANAPIRAGGIIFHKNKPSLSVRFGVLAILEPSSCRNHTPVSE